MSQTNPFVPGWVYRDPLYSVSPLSLKISRIVTTSVVMIVVATIWLRAGWEIEGLISKLLGVVLLADVLFMPSLISWREKRSGKKVESSVFAAMGYSWLMLMAVLVLPLLLRIR